MSTLVLRARTASNPAVLAPAKKPTEPFRLVVSAPDALPAPLAPAPVPEAEERRPGLGIIIAVSTSVVLWACIGTAIAAIF